MLIRARALCLLALFLLAAPAAADLVLDEDFEDGVADDFTVLAGNWTVADGAYHCYQEGVEIYALARAGSASWQDYRFSGRMMVEGSVNHVLRVRNNDGNSYEIVLRSGYWTDAYLYKWADGVRSELLSVPHDGLGTGIWRDFEIVVAGNHILFSFAGQLIIDHHDTDSPHLAGGIVLTAVPGGAVGWQHAHFDDLQVDLLTTANGDTSWGAIKSLF